MGSRRRDLIIAAVILFLALAISVPIIMVGQMMRPEIEKVWTIDEFTWIRDETLNIEGSILVDHKSTLLLENVELVINAHDDFDPFIFVGGKMIINNTIIRGDGYGFIVWGQLIANNSDISGMMDISRKIDGYPKSGEGLTFDASGTAFLDFGVNPLDEHTMEWGSISTITNSKIHNAYGSGLSVYSSTIAREQMWGEGFSIDPVIRNCEIYNCEVGITAMDTGFPMLEMTEIHDCNTGMMIDVNDNDIELSTIRNISITNNIIGIEFRGLRLNLIGNTIYGNDIGVRDLGFSYYSSPGFHLFENTFSRNNVALECGSGTKVENCTFIRNHISMILDEDNIVSNTTIERSSMGFESAWSSPRISNCSFIEVTRHMMIEGSGHPIVNDSDIDFDLVYWGYYNEWEDFNSTITIDREVFYPVEERATYLGIWREYDPYDYWD